MKQQQIFVFKLKNLHEFDPSYEQINLLILILVIDYVIINFSGDNLRM